MKLWEIAVGLVITLVLLYAVRSASMRRQPPIEESTRSGQLKLRHTSSHLFKGDTTNAPIVLRVFSGIPPEGSRGILYYRQRELGEQHGSGRFAAQSMEFHSGDEIFYQTIFKNQGRGTEFEYYLQLEDAGGSPAATIPDSRSSDQSSSLWLRFEGKRSAPLLIAHIVGMFVSLLFMVFAFLTSLENLANHRASCRLGKQVLWATIILFVGGFLTGFWINYQVYGVYWTGFPIGKDITDSKTLLILVFWALLLFLLNGSAFSSEPSKNILRPWAARALTITIFVLTLGVYLIPHSFGNY